MSSLVAAWASLAFAEAGDLDQAQTILNHELKRGHYKKRKNCWAVYINLAQAKLKEKMGDLESALTQANDALDIAKTSSDPVHEAYARVEMWHIMTKLERPYPENQLQIAYKLAKECGMKPLLGQISSHLDETALGAGHGFDTGSHKQ